MDLKTQITILREHSVYLTKLSTEGDVPKRLIGLK